MELALLSLENATFKGYGSNGYTHFTGGAALTPNAFWGMPTMPIRDVRASDHQRSPDDLSGAQAYLRQHHPSVRKLLHVRERAERDPSSFPEEGGGASGMPSISEGEEWSFQTNDAYSVGGEAANCLRAQNNTSLITIGEMDPAVARIRAAAKKNRVRPNEATGDRS